MSKAYLIRAQGLGIVWDKVFTAPPAQADVEAVLVDELRRHGIDREGKAKRRWVTVVEVDLVTPTGPPADAKTIGELDSDELAALAAQRATSPAGGQAAEPTVHFDGVGHVQNPEI